METLKFESIDNPAVNSIHGAGVKAAQTVIEKGAETIITGNIGPNAYQVLSSNGIKIISGATGTIKEVIERFKQGEFKEATSFTAPPHSGVSERMGMDFQQKRGKEL
jgi:predicted Fe-Mo cluster-binding NifX family protein